MNAVAQFLVTNAIAAAVLAVSVLALARIWRNPHVGHVLWLVVLVKLVFPPLVEIPVPAGLLGQSSHLAPRDEVRRDASRLAERDVYAAPAVAAISRMPVERSAGSVFANSNADSTAPPTALLGVPQPSASYQAVAAARSQSDPPGDSKVAPAATWAMAAWLAGSVLVALIVACRTIRFARTVREMLPAATSLQTTANELAARFKLRRFPAVRLTTADLTPLLWPGWRRPAIVLPARLAGELSGAEIRTILAHELAHLYRRDHWVRWLEVLVTVLYWWHPVVWLARRELRRCEDICCDACVLRLLPNCERIYAEAMFHTASHVSRLPRPLPVLASSFGRSRSMKRRIEMVLNSRLPNRLNATARVLLLAAAMAALAASVGRSQDDRPVSVRLQAPSGPNQANPQAAPKVAAKQAEAAPAGFAGGYGRSPSLAMSMDFSSDGSILVGACSDQVIRVWDARLGIPLHVLTGHAKTPNAVVITPDNAFAISASYDGEIIVWDLQSGRIRERRILDGRQDAFLSPTFTEDAKTLLTRGRDDETLYVWDVTTGTMIQTIPLAPLGKPFPSGLSLSGDGKIVAVLVSPDFPVVRSSTATVWDLDTGQMRFGHDFVRPAHRLAMSPGGDLLAAANSEGVHIISTEDGKVIRTLPARLRAPHAMMFSQDGSLLAVGGEGTQVREDSSNAMRIRSSSEFHVWDVQTGRQLVSDGGIDGDSTSSFAFGADDRYLAHCDRKRIVILNPADRQHRMVIPLPPSEEGDYVPGDRTAELVHILREEKLAREEQWSAVVRELATIGRPAVKPLVRELDSTGDPQLMKILAIALRQVGEPEATPALIRAIPKSLQPTNRRVGDGFLSVPNPVREVCGALAAITGVSLGEDELYSVTLGGGRKQQELQRELYARVADRWQTWWQENWRQYLDDPALAEVDADDDNQPAKPLFSSGPDIEAGQFHVGTVIESIYESESRTFLDLDTGRDAKWPVDIPRPDSKLSELPAAIEQWAAQEGLDIVGTEYRAEGSDEWSYCLRGVDLKAWEVDNDRWETIREEVRKDDPLTLGRPVEDGYLMHFDKTTGKYDPAASATFLFVTRDGARGVLQVVTQVRRIIGPNEPPQPVREFIRSDAGFRKGVRIQRHLIYEKLE